MLLWKLLGTFLGFCVGASVLGLMVNEKFALSEMELSVALAFLVIGAMVTALWV
jgi:hypothetical protein